MLQFVVSTIVRIPLGKHLFIMNPLVDSTMQSTHIESTKTWRMFTFAFTLRSSVHSYTYNIGDRWWSWHKWESNTIIIACECLVSHLDLFEQNAII